MNRWFRISSRMLIASLLLAIVLVQPGAAADEAADKAAKKAEKLKQKKLEAQAAKKKAARNQPAEVADTTPAPTARPEIKTPVGVANSRDLAAKIDQAIEAKLAGEKIPASPQADDAEFLRRVCLDITGVIPTPERTKAFLDSTDPDKRAKLIDELLASPEYGRRMADIWQDLLLTRTSDNRRLNPAPFYEWLTESFNANMAWNAMGRELITASGPQDKSPAVTYFLANSSVDKITDNVSKNLLGIQLQCAQCHNHPFTGWKQDEYWGMASFFMKVRPDAVNAAARNGNVPGVNEGPQVNRNRRNLPESAKLVNAKFLQGNEPKLDTSAPYRPTLADWAASGTNPFFAKAMVNRIWHQYMGMGLVNPVDDMHIDNVATHPELLEQLAAGFVANGFDVKELIRGLCNSEAYQRTSKPLPENVDAPTHYYARMNIKVLVPEMLYDSLTQVSGSGRTPAPRPNANGRPVIGPREQFVLFFRAEEGADPTEYQSGIPQALRLMNSAQFNRANAADRLAKNGSKPEENIEQLYLTALSRRPTKEETDKLTAYVARSEDARAAYNDILWALINCSEFALNR